MTIILLLKKKWHIINTFKDQEIKLHFLYHIVLEKIYLQTVYIYFAEHQRQKYKFVTIKFLKHLGFMQNMTRF